MGEDHLMQIKKLFPTQIYHSATGLAPEFLDGLLQESMKIAEIDELGLQWSEERYFGGYTSYSSYNQLQEFSSEFKKLAESFDPHLKAYIEALGYDIEADRLRMSNCWLNIMPQGTHHSGHIHPHSVISGSFYLQVPEDSPGIKFEDPRLAMQMNMPIRRKDAAGELQSFYQVAVREGDLILFESYLRHEVEANRSEEDRISVSFNYDWV